MQDSMTWTSSSGIKKTESYTTKSFRLVRETTRILLRIKAERWALVITLSCDLSTRLTILLSYSRLYYLLETKSPLNNPFSIPEPAISSKGYHCEDLAFTDIVNILESMLSSRFYFIYKTTCHFLRYILITTPNGMSRTGSQQTFSKEIGQGPMVKLLNNVAYN